jgi:hypothetical protein
MDSRQEFTKQLERLPRSKEHRAIVDSPIIRKIRKGGEMRKE